MDRLVAARHEQGARTRFRVYEEGEEEVAEIVFGSDIYPGGNVVDPNSSLSMKAAVAHELTHYYRWQNKTEIDEEPLVEIDEALTSLEAARRFPRHLDDHDIQQLIADAIQRLQMYVAKQRES